MLQNICWKFFNKTITGRWRGFAEITQQTVSNIRNRVTLILKELFDYLFLVHTVYCPLLSRILFAQLLK